MKRFVTWLALAFLVAVAVARWRRMQESPDRQVPSGGSEEPAASDPGPSSPPAGGTGEATRRGDEAEQADEPESGVEATPGAERLAEQLGVDLSQVRGTGSGGRITVKDVQNAANNN
jgi:pyruvate dehydrogenase E2 component (dihydrolipoamide acetyltransferase)